MIFHSFNLPASQIIIKFGLAARTAARTEMEMSSVKGNRDCQKENRYFQRLLF